MEPSNWERAGCAASGRSARGRRLVGVGEADQEGGELEVGCLRVDEL